MTHLIEVAFPGNRKEFFLWEAESPPTVRAHVIVEGDRGEDIGLVHAVGESAERRSLGCGHGCGTGAPSRRALRMATPADVSQGEQLRKLGTEARRHAAERARSQNLDMKISDAEWQWDRRKLTFYFTAERRVDFRQLVRDLASQFRTRIELKQIGVRDEAKRLDGVGRCGRQYCSASWLPDLRPVNLGVAKEQRLSLNPAQISGACGRLMCCLRYEHETYVAARKRFPKEGRVFTTSRGEEKVMAVDIFSERVSLRGGDGEARSVSLAEFQRETGASANAPVILVEEPEDTSSGEGVLEDSAPAPASPPRAKGPNVNTASSERRPRRRRGRRGGRGRGEGAPGDAPPEHGSQPPD